MTKRKLQYWVIPPKCDGEFVACMEDVLQTYEKPYDPAVPVLCMDEQPVQLIKEKKVPIRATKTRPKRVDYEYERAGVTNVFMFAEPLAGWRYVSIRQNKTKVDWALEMASVLESRYEACDRVIVVCDNLSTHTKGAFYETFKPERAFALSQKLEFHFTPKHGSWLNIAENDPPAGGSVKSKSATSKLALRASILQRSRQKVAPSSYSSRVSERFFESPFVAHAWSYD